MARMNDEVAAVLQEYADLTARASNNGINRAPGKPSRAAGVFAVPPASSEGDRPLVAVEDAVQNQTVEDR